MNGEADITYTKFTFDIISKQYTQTTSSASTLPFHLPNPPSVYSGGGFSSR